MQILHSTRQRLIWGTFRVPFTVFLAGINLILIQWIMVRELTMVLLGTELVILLVITTYFLGLSVGYLLAGRIKAKWLPALAGATLVIHLTLPVLFRLLSGWLYGRNIFWAAFLILPLLMPFTVSAFYSILLPLYIENNQGRLVTLYTVELVGAACGVLVLIGIGSLGLTALYVVYTPILIGLLVSLGLRWRWLIVLGALAAVWLYALPALDSQSNAYWFGQVFELSNPVTVFSAYSPYQKVDIIDDGTGTRYLFLNGLVEYGYSIWERLNVVLGEVPARLIRPQSMVTVGAGTMALEGLTAPFAGHITTVELDPIVVSGSQQYFEYVNHADQLTNWSYTIDDAKHFFATTSDRFDLVTMNVPAPLTGQTTTLYSAPFYASIKDRLKPRGVLAVSLTLPLNDRNVVAKRIAAGVLANYRHIISVTPKSVGITFLYAGDDLPFTMAEVESSLKGTGEVDYIIADETALRVLVGDAQPITYDDLSVALSESARRVYGLLKPW